MKTYFIDVLLHHYADFSGRATRKQYWLFALWWAIFALVCIFLCVLFAMGGIVIGEKVAISCILLLSLLPLVFIIPHIAIFVRRVRDTGHSAYWGLLMTPWVIESISNYLQNILRIKTLTPSVVLIRGLAFLCFFGILIFCLLPSKQQTDI